MNIQLENNEFDFIINVLGDLPTKSGAFMLLQKMSIQKKMQDDAAQAAAQLSKEELKTEEPKAE